MTFVPGLAKVADMLIVGSKDAILDVADRCDDFDDLKVETTSWTFINVKGQRGQAILTWVCNKLKVNAG